MTFLVRAAAIAPWLLFAAIGCGAHFDGTLLKKREVSYRVGRLPAAFQRVHVEGNDLAFYQPGAGSIAVHATCSDYDDVPNEVLLNHLLFGTTQRVFRLDDELTLDGRGARHAVVDAELDGVPLRLELLVLRHSSCVFDLSYVSDRNARAHDEFLRFAQAFHVVEVAHE